MLSKCYLLQIQFCKFNLNNKLLSFRIPFLSLSLFLLRIVIPDFSSFKLSEALSQIASRILSLFISMLEYYISFGSLGYTEI